MRNPSQKLTDHVRARVWVITLARKNPGKEIPARLISGLAKTDSATVRAALAPLVARGHLSSRNDVKTVYWLAVEDNHA